MRSVEGGRDFPLAHVEKQTVFSVKLAITYWSYNADITGLDCSASLSSIRRSVGCLLVVYRMAP